MSPPKFYVLIPTRERGDVLESALRTVTSQDYDNLEIIVSDNFSGDHTESVARDTGDSRVRYVNTGRRLSMSHNWEFALSHIGEGWVMILGDDDGLLPGSLKKLAEVVGSEGVAAISSSIGVFMWPSPDNQFAGRLHVPMRSGYEVRDSRVWLRKVISGRTWYNYLPMLYTGGLVHSSLIGEIRRKRGSFYHSHMPDVFSSIALASMIDRYVYLHEPFAIGGHSKHSNSAAWAATWHNANKKWPTAQASMFRSEPNIGIHRQIPVPADGVLPPVIDIFVYESYLQSDYVHRNAVGTTAAQQLALFLARGVERSDKGAAWAKSFAELHKLDLQKIRASVLPLKLRTMYDKMMHNLTEFAEFYRIEPSFGIRMRDVYEASIVAGAVLKTRPNRMRSYANTLRRRLRIAAGYAAPA